MITEHQVFDTQGNRRTIFIQKGQVKGHYRMVNGKKVFVKPHSDSRTKKEKPSSDKKTMGTAIDHENAMRHIDRFEELDQKLADGKITDSEKKQLDKEEQILMNLKLLKRDGDYTKKFEDIFVDGKKDIGKVDWDKVYGEKKESESDESIDYFEQHEKQPKEVKKILSKYEMEEPSYKMMEKLHKELGKIGWTFESGLDAQPYDLRPVKK